MSLKIRRLLAVLLLAALPLQGQAVAAMSCHSSADSAELVSQAVLHEKSHAHDSHAHSHPAPDVIFKAEGVHHTSGTEPAAQLASSCALCAASCAMAHVIPVSVESSFPQLESSSITLSSTPRYSSVVLEGLLRPPRS
jgi:hypothetical protein